MVCAVDCACPLDPTAVDCACAMAPFVVTAEEVAVALAAARALSESWYEIVPSDAVRRTAERLLRTHPLRAADALQLAAALVAADYNPASLEIVCLDEPLRLAARREGFTVLGA